MHSQALMIFVKNPQKGKVKTRLASSIGDDRALAVYLELLEHTKTAVLPVACEKMIFYSQFIDHSDLWPEPPFKKRLQKGTDLGEKMLNAFKSSFAEGFRSVIIIGSDCPGINDNLLEEAFGALEQHDTVIGPAKDGGYYLLGMKALLPALFQGKAWSTASVFETTIQDLQHAGLSVAQLPELSDIDHQEDLEAWYRTRP